MDSMSTLDNVVCCYSPHLNTSRMLFYASLFCSKASKCLFVFFSCRGYNIGVRLIDEFLAKSNVSRCVDFKETAEVIAKVCPSLSSMYYYWGLLAILIQHLCLLCVFVLNLTNTAGVCFWLPGH